MGYHPLVEASWIAGNADDHLLREKQEAYQLWSSSGMETMPLSLGNISILKEKAGWGGWESNRQEG